eukprot:TRINITY_DN2029_c0_g1_i11.p1 TRINITY_DN2029_c0_g1~~TRINITY_DN2029_c0_g1_i11.p1  ORF type:complete len:138 (-),score=27.21 TRINITY_DN2029_c0_g1_i11:440-853(-)
MQEVAGERGGYLHGRGALDSDDLLYLKEQMEAEEDAERLLRRTEKRAFAAFKKAASLADSSPASLPLPLRVEPKTKSGISISMKATRSPKEHCANKAEKTQSLEPILGSKPIKPNFNFSSITGQKSINSNFNHSSIA